MFNNAITRGRENLKRIRTAQELYNEVLKFFYFGIYQKDDRFLSYQEAHESYGLSKDMIARAYNMLRCDGFIRTDGTNGTVVTFDTNNPEHVARVPLEWPKSIPADTIPYEVSMKLHAQSLYIGLTHSSEEQLQACKAKVRDILHYAQDGCPCQEQIFAFWMCAISSLHNECLSRITDHFISRYLYLLPPSRLSPAQRKLISASALAYYEFLLDAMERREFDAFPTRFEQHYHNYYQYGGVVFAKLEDGTIFKEQALYGKLLDDLCMKIISGELQKGDSLPTTKHFCEKYGVSATTVNRVYGILAEMGFIKRRVRSGTKLIAGPDDCEIWEALEKIAEAYRCDWENAIEVMFIINSVLSKRIAITPDIVQQMRAELAIQYDLFECYATPYFPFAVLLRPLVFSLPAGILHRYYVLVSDALDNVLTLCTFRLRWDKQRGQEAYQSICNAIEALESGNQPLFATLSEQTMRKNVELLNRDYAEIRNGITNKGTHQ